MESIPQGPYVDFNGAAVLHQPSEGPSTIVTHKCLNMHKTEHVLFRFPKRSAGEKGELRAWREGIIGQVTEDGVRIDYKHGHENCVVIAPKDYADQIKSLVIVPGSDDTPSSGPAVSTSTNPFHKGQHLLFRVATNANGVGKVRFGDFREGEVKGFNDLGVSIEYSSSNRQICLVFVQKKNYNDQLRLHVQEPGMYDI